MKRDLLGVVMCGGNSSRMGSDKADLKIRPGISQLDYVLELLDSVCRERAVCVGPVEKAKRVLPPGVTALLDVEEVAGPMAGVLAALRFASGRAVFVCACDMPYLEPRHMVQLVNRRDPAKIASAFQGADGFPEPMCAIYEPACLSEMETFARTGNHSLRGFLIAMGTEQVAPDEPFFLASVNDKAELERARSRLR